MAAIDYHQDSNRATAFDARRDLPARDEIDAAHLVDETRLVGGLIERAVYTSDERRRADVLAQELVRTARAEQSVSSGVSAFTHEYGLSSEEGILLMCLAESLLRIPDRETADRLIAEKIGDGAWEAHLGQSENFYVNASTWGLLLTGRLVRMKASDRRGGPVRSLQKLVARTGDPLVRNAVRHAVQVLGEQFVLGRTIEEALKRSKAWRQKGYLFSYDMLGEAAQCEADAKDYFDAYLHAINAIGDEAGPFDKVHADDLMRRPGISVKLSALHPRFQPGKEERLARELVPRVLQLAEAAQKAGLSVTIDTEEQERLQLTLDVFAQCFVDKRFANWSGFGLAVQAYGKRAIPILRWLRRLAHGSGRQIPVRLVKGAYWDSEIKWAQQRGWENYPVFTRKLHTDVSYLACVRLILSDRSAFYGQFATHNAHSLAAAYVAAGKTHCEFQRLHGMGEALYQRVISPDGLNARARIYAPVGGHEDLLAYLVRRLLENGTNTSFVNQLADTDTPVEDIVRDPVETAESERTQGISQQWRSIPRPAAIYAPDRVASSGLALSEPVIRQQLGAQLRDALVDPFVVSPIVDGKARQEAADVDLFCPHDYRARLGTLHPVRDEHIEAALHSAERVADDFGAWPAEKRAQVLELAADRMEQARVAFMAVIIREAGRTVQAAHDEVREAVDFLRYYAFQARTHFSAPTKLKSPTGETNELRLCARGPFAIIAPWNFPLAIFIGQAAAALAAGNPVVTKPAEQTPITGAMAVRLLIEAGFPPEAVQFLPGDGAVGEKIVRDVRIKGVAFTGSQQTAWAIQRALADRGGPIVPLIAETGGVNALIADSSALPEQLVRDCVRSAFESAGQRCSAARILAVQEDIADKTIEMLVGAIEALDLGDPLEFSTDVGPVIDEVAQDALDAHKLAMQKSAKRLVDVAIPDACRAGNYVGPAAYQVESVSQVGAEVFGPVLHVCRFRSGELNDVVDAVNALGFGLTMGLHTRIAGVAEEVAARAKVGNLYINRDQVGAVVGVQPFGGEGLSGSGPKAGGPNYLQRFATERVVTADITATGGNAQLLRLAAERE